ncbi:MAG: PP2C family serine/threonine-protein phosphatase [Anaerolineales bacterium]
MVNPQPVPPVHRWRVIGETVRGASHVRARQRRQDAIRWQIGSETNWFLMLAVSDGHGSAKSFRSHLGANRAVRAAERELNHLLESNPDLSNLSAVKRMAEERLPQMLARAWDQGVNAHLRRYPFTPEELETLTQKRGETARQRVEDHPALAYGATILAALITQAFILYVQLGDGDVLEVSRTGEVTRPLPPDEKLFADQTTSLYTPNAWRDFRVAFQVLSGEPPALILLSTDGYANSFRDNASFLQVGSDLLEIIREEGLDAVEKDLSSWLKEASESGSGDDVTLGIICWLEAVEKPAPQPGGGPAQGDGDTNGIAVESAEEALQTIARLASQVLGESSSRKTESNAPEVAKNP